MDLEQMIKEQRAAKEHKKAHIAQANALTAHQLADQLTASLGLDDLENIDKLAERLTRLAHTLDSVFFTALHQAGLVFEHSLQRDSTHIALLAQRLCRQTFESLKHAHALNSDKQKEGLEKCKP